MKSMHCLVRKLLLGAVALTIMSSVVPARADKVSPGAAKVIRLTGNVRYSTDRQTWKTLKKGTVLKSPVMIQTAPFATVDLCLNEGRAKTSHDGMEANTDNVIRIFENSSLGIDKLATTRTGAETSDEIQLDLHGMIMGTVGKLSADSKYEIKMPKGVAGVRGGTYIAASSGVVNVLDGLVIVVVVGADGTMNTKKVMSRQGFDPSSGTITALSLEIYPQPLSCSESKSTPSNAGPAPVAPVPGAPRGPGLGGSLRKF